MMLSRPEAGGKNSLVREDSSPPLKLIIAGGPGCGKGSLSKAIVEKFGVVHVSVGDILRSREDDGSELGQQVRPIPRPDVRALQRTPLESFPLPPPPSPAVSPSGPPSPGISFMHSSVAAHHPRTPPLMQVPQVAEYIRSGRLVPDELAIDIVKQKLQSDECKAKGWLLDNFPRTADQAMAMIEHRIVPQQVHLPRLCLRAPHLHLSTRQHAPMSTRGPSTLYSPPSSSPHCPRLALSASSSLTTPVLPVPQYLHIEVPDHILVERCLGRLIDPVTGAIYHKKFNPPPGMLPPTFTFFVRLPSLRPRNALHQFQVDV